MAVPDSIPMHEIRALLEAAEIARVDGGTVLGTWAAWSLLDRPSCATLAAKLGVGKSTAGRRLLDLRKAVASLSSRIRDDFERRIRPVYGTGNRPTGGTRPVCGTVLGGGRGRRPSHPEDGMKKKRARHACERWSRANGVGPGQAEELLSYLLDRMKTREQNKQLRPIGNLERWIPSVLEKFCSEQGIRTSGDALAALLDGQIGPGRDTRPSRCPTCGGGLLSDGGCKRNFAKSARDRGCAGPLSPESARFLA